MKRIAIIFQGDLKNRKGLVNACLSRIKHLYPLVDYQIDLYVINEYDTWLSSILRKKFYRRSLPTVYELDGLKIQMIWKRFSLLNYLIVQKLHLNPIEDNTFNNKNIARFKNYDLISAHSHLAASLAYTIFEKFGIKYCVSWHGSDIHTIPFMNKLYFQNIKQCIKSAQCNFFVSRKLLSISDKICQSDNKIVLYNGVGDDFVNFSPSQKWKIRQLYNKESYKIVGFVGNLIDVKNVLVLPTIFKNITSLYHGNVQFWIIGDGNLASKLESLLQESGINFKMWGNQPVHVMPAIMNCIDVLVLPSKNEGLPLVVLEAMACGANVVGSDVGGIKEAIGENNVFALDEKFVTNITHRIVYMLKNEVKQSLSDKFSWDNTAFLENTFYKDILNR